MSFYENRHFFHKTPFSSPKIPTGVPNGARKEANRQILGDGRGVATPWRRRGDAATKGGSK
jgi:hypothetical protein